MPTKARLHENCWAYDERLPDLGWPAALNSFPRSSDLGWVESPDGGFVAGIPEEA